MYVLASQFPISPRNISLAEIIKNRYATMLFGQHCFWLSTILNNIVEPELDRNQV